MEQANLIDEEKIMEESIDESLKSAEEGKPMEDAIPVTSRKMMKTEVVRPMVTVDEAIAGWNQYQDLVKRLLSDSDYQPIGNRQFKKKSAWRKLATVFNISDEIVSESRKEYAEMEYTEKIYQDGKFLEERIAIKPGFVYEVVAKATAPNGRFVTGMGSCASNERGFAHVEHDVRSTAHTRAKNRAISDLIGAGEVSAEEMEGQANQEQPSGEDLGVCKKCGAPNKIYKTGRKGCSKYCWRTS